MKASSEAARTGHRNRVEPLGPALGLLGISVMWVAENGSVAVEGPRVRVHRPAQMKLRAAPGR